MAKGLKGFLEKLFGSKSARDMKMMEPILAAVLQAREPLAAVSDDELRHKREEFKERLDGGETLDDLLPEAFGVVWEACRRLAERGASWPVWEHDTVWDMVPYDVQIIGAVILHKGKIAEMVTGEGKTLVAMMPLYLNSLPGKGAHLVTVNDYLARRDAEWMGGVLKFLGCTVDYITNNMTPDQRRVVYGADVTYGTNNEFGFDYLRDNMAIAPEHLVQREYHYAIVDEVDSVLIDEARTPLIISGAVAKSTHRFEELKPRVERLVRRQSTIVNNWVGDVERVFNNSVDGDDVKIDDETALKLLRISRGAPKNRRFRRLVQIPGILETIKRTEEAYMSNKAMWEADEDLLYVVEEKHRSADLTDKGRDLLGKEEADFFILPDLAMMTGEIQSNEDLSEEEKAKRLEKIEQDYAIKNEQIANIDQLLRAYSLYAKDDEYVIQDAKIVIVDEFTGRIMPGRRFSEGLHQALEAKEGVKVEKETQTLATVTIQNFFRMYEKLAGMTGTAETEEAEFGNIYKLDVVAIPTNRPVARMDFEDVIYRTKKEKYMAIADEVGRLHEAGHPVLVGTTTVEVSELLSRLLRGRKINHHVLNAKHHRDEAEIIAGAGRRGAVTIATNMAGRGTDIKLEKGILEIEGEDSEEPNGLHIIGTERHESRRIDNQLRGRAGRQGDSGASIFFLSLEDNLMRLFSPDRLIKVMDRLGVEEGEVITHKMVTRAIEKAQVKVEARNFDIRKHLLEYDDVVNRQREVIYSLRRETLLEDDVSEIMRDYLEEAVDALFAGHIDSDGPPDYWDVEGLAKAYRALVLSPIELQADELRNMGGEAIRRMLIDDSEKRYLAKEARLTPDLTRRLEKYVFLQTIDEHWRDHLNELLMLRSGIGLRSYAQRDPLLEYKSEAFSLFEGLMAAVRDESVRIFFRAELAVQPPPEQVQQMQERKQDVSAYGAGETAGALPVGHSARQQPPQPGKPQPVQREEPKVGRNDPCPCGSGKKFKKCCGR